MLKKLNVCMTQPFVFKQHQLRLTAGHECVELLFLSIYYFYTCIFWENATNRRNRIRYQFHLYKHWFDNSLPNIFHK